MAPAILFTVSGDRLTSPSVSDLRNQDFPMVARVELRDFHYRFDLRERLGILNIASNQHHAARNRQIILPNDST